jgi:hypothetical protein
MFAGRPSPARSERIGLFMDLPFKVIPSRSRRADTRSYHQWRAARERRAFLLFVAPAVFAFVFIMLWPLVNMFYLSLTDWQGLVKPKIFVGELLPPGG